jgi:predicted adenylyl cyclase CyaB
MVTFGEREVEVKFRIDNPSSIRTLLSGMMVENSGMKKEKNFYMTNRVLGIGEAGGTIVRVRTYEDIKGVLVTYKGRPDQKEKMFKSRPEIEFKADDAKKVLNFLKAIGFTVGWIQEKERETWAMGNADVSIDLLPVIGYYLEIEGEKEAIFKTAEVLGLDMKKSTNKSYRELYIEECRKKKIPVANMVFSSDGGEK